MRLLYLLTLTVLCSCTGYQYVASPQYVPLNTQKGELKANLSHNHMQAGYSVSNHVSLFSTGYWRSGKLPGILDGLSKEHDDSDDYSDKAYEITGGASYYTVHNRFIYEVHVGAGGGKIDYLHSREPAGDYYVMHMKAHRATVFIQPSFAYRFYKDPAKNFVELGAFTRLIAYRYHNLQTTTTISPSYPHKIEPFDTYFANRGSRDIYFAEPGFCFRVGGQNLKFNMLTSFPISLQGDNVRFRSGNLYMGFFINLNVLERKTYGYKNL